MIIMPINKKIYLEFKIKKQITCFEPSDEMFEHKRIDVNALENMTNKTVPNVRTSPLLLIFMHVLYNTSQLRPHHQENSRQMESSILNPNISGD